MNSRQLRWHFLVPLPSGCPLCAAKHMHSLRIVASPSDKTKQLLLHFKNLCQWESSGLFVCPEVKLLTKCLFFCLTRLFAPGERLEDSHLESHPVDLRDISWSPVLGLWLWRIKSGTWLTWEDSGRRQTDLRGAHYFNFIWHSFTLDRLKWMARVSPLAVRTIKLVTWESIVIFNTSLTGQTDYDHTIVNGNKEYSWLSDKSQ